MKVNKLNVIIKKKINKLNVIINKWMLFHNAKMIYNNKIL